MKYKLSQIADDTSLYLDGIELSLNEALLKLEEFSILNCQTTKIIWIGSKKYTNQAIKTKWKLGDGLEPKSFMTRKIHGVCPHGTQGEKNNKKNI